MDRLDIKIRNVKYHRNGVGGNGFHVVLFDYKCDMTGKRRKMVAIYRPKIDEHSGNDMNEFSPDIAILDLQESLKGNVGYPDDKGCNRWRGDQFEPYIRKAVRDHDRMGVTD